MPILSGTNSSHFSIIGSKILYLAPGETGYITVRYKPLESGSSVATLNLVHNADNYNTPPYKLLSTVAQAHVPISFHLVEGAMLIVRLFQKRRWRLDNKRLWIQL